MARAAGRAVVAAGAASVLGLAVPGAHAASDSTSLGGCSYGALGRAGQGWTAGEIDVEAVVYSPTPDANPVWATVTCYILVNGAPQPGAIITASGVGVIAGGGAITYTSDHERDFVQLCQRVDFTGPGDATPTSDVCLDYIVIEIPPPLPWDPDRWP